MHGNAAPARDIADDVVARHGVTALGQAHEHIVLALDDDAAARVRILLFLAARFFLRLRLDGMLRLRELFRLRVLSIFLAKARKHLIRREPAEADGGVKIVDVI